MDRRTEIQQRLEALALPVVHGLGLSLWGLEYLPLGRKALVRVYLDGPDGISIDQCALISRQLSPALEVEDAVPGTFTLEVSSPGLERVFFHPEQLNGYIGQTVAIKLKEPLDERKAFKGPLIRVEDALVTVEDSGREWILPWDHIKKMHLVYLFEQNTP